VTRSGGAGDRVRGDVRGWVRADLGRLAGKVGAAGAVPTRIVAVTTLRQA